MAPIRFIYTTFDEYFSKDTLFLVYMKKNTYFCNYNEETLCLIVVLR